MFEWDEKKRKSNLAKHGVDFSLVEELDWETALQYEARQEYGETRYITMGYIGERLYVCIHTLRGANRRIISLRKANQRELTIYGQEKVFN